MDGAPLMKFLRTARAGLPENAAMAARLSAVADRGKIEAAKYSGTEEPAPLGIQHRFWTPREVEEQGDHK